MTLADKIVVLDAGRVAQVGNRWSCITIRQTVLSPDLSVLKDELPASKSDRHRNRSSAGELPMPNRQQVWLPVESRDVQLEPICHWVFARNIYCRVISLRHP